MKRTASQRLSPSAFTLIELLTVIGIIAVLMTLLFPAVNAVKENARRMDAKNTCVQIVTAVKQYYQEYGKFPPVVEDAAANPTAPNAQRDTVVGDDAMSAPVPNNTLFHTLRAIAKPPNTDHQFNRRRISFFEGKAVASVTANKPRNGFYDRGPDGAMPPPNQDGALFDPWGHQYGVIMDTNYDNRIDLVGFYTDFAGAEADGGLAPRQTVGAFSMGKDETLGKRNDRTYKRGTEVSDDVISWQ
jgi:prepilin-type N-terminal cleavage/methylation domain-containing protein